MAIEDLMAILPPPLTPRYPGTSERWATAEARLGFHFPTDFKDFIRLYGSGWLVGDYQILNPMVTPWENAPADLGGLTVSFDVLSRHVLASLGRAAPWEGWLLDVAAISGVYSEARAITGDTARFPYPVWPPIGGMLPWAASNEAGALMWLTEGEPDSWPVVDGYPNEDERLHPGPMTRLLAGWLRGEQPYVVSRLNGEEATPQGFFTQTMNGF